MLILIFAQCGTNRGRVNSHDSTVTVLYPGDERVVGPNSEMPAKFLVFLPLVTNEMRSGIVLSEDEDRMYENMMPVFTEDLRVTFLFPEIQTFIVHEKIQGLSSPNRADPVMFMEDLWLEDQQ